MFGLLTLAIALRYGRVGANNCGPCDTAGAQTGINQLSGGMPCYGASVTPMSGGNQQGGIGGVIPCQFLQQNYAPECSYMVTQSCTQSPLQNMSTTGGQNQQFYGGSSSGFGGMSQQPCMNNGSGSGDMGQQMQQSCMNNGSGSGGMGQQTLSVGGGQNQIPSMSQSYGYGGPSTQPPMGQISECLSRAMRQSNICTDCSKPTMVPNIIEVGGVRLAASDTVKYSPSTCESFSQGGCSSNQSSGSSSPCGCMTK